MSTCKAQRAVVTCLKHDETKFDNIADFLVDIAVVRANLSQTVKHSVADVAKSVDLYSARSVFEDRTNTPQDVLDDLDLTHWVALAHAAVTYTRSAKPLNLNPSK